MNKKITKIGIFLLTIILLPSVILITYQFYNLSDNEKILGDIYNNQLDAILFSVNQYSEDVLSDWADQINKIIEDNLDSQKSLRENISKYLEINPAINMVFISDSSNNSNLVFPSTKIKLNEKSNSNFVFDVLKKNKSKTKRLYNYKDANYRKLEPIARTSDPDNEVVIIFISEFKIGEKNLCGIVINPNLMAESVLSPKIRSIAQNEFLIAIFDDNDKNIIYQNSDFNTSLIKQKRPLWLIPGGSIGILLKGESIEGIVSDKLNNFIIIIVLLGVVLIIGIWFVFGNIKKELELAQIKSDFVSNVSHELRTPLALISMYSETLELGRVKSEEKKGEYYKIISKETDRLGKIVNSILNFSNMEAGKRVYKFEKINFREIICEILDNYQFHFDHKSFTITKNITEKEIYISGDKEALSEAILNLIDNAVKYSKEKKEITISLKRNDNKVLLEISDKGIGISQDNQKKIFEKFYRVSSGLVHDVKGTGLGLSIVKQIIDQHKGSIKLKSKIGDGTTFTISLPILEK